MSTAVSRVRGEIIEARAKRRKGEMKLAKLGEIAAGCRLQRERQRNARLDIPTCSATIFMSKVVMFLHVQSGDVPFHTNQMLLDKNHKFLYITQVT